MQVGKGSEKRKIPTLSPSAKVIACGMSTLTEFILSVRPTLAIHSQGQQEDVSAVRYSITIIILN